MAESSSTEYQSVLNVIRRRQTFKVLGDPESNIELSDEARNVGDQAVADAIKEAAWAPFHYDRNVDGLVEPWRVDWVKRSKCRWIAGELRNWFDDVKPSNKLPSMLAACGSLVLISWLPQFREGPEVDGPNAAQLQTDEEHLAATSAYVQNLMLLLTARGLGTYWSSGGQFRQHAMFEKLGLPHRGRLLAALFVDYSNDPQDGLQRLPGKHRERRCPDQKWLSVVDD